ncbi:MAG: lysophospholipid acyltransferase family protein, partial [Gammaproteobacteria bacterium]|nr:lysophospholipid acyltransferase family protein [Gammaproteobacteria bacterium]
LLPLAVAHALGAKLGSLFNLFNNPLRHVARQNIDLCFPEWTQQQRHRLVRECLQETAKAALETGGIWLWSPEHILAKVREVSGASLLEEAMAKGKGAILVAPHLGAWEMAGLYCGMLRPITALYRPPRIQGVDTLIREARERIGSTLVPTDGGGIRILYKALRRGELVGLLPDQDPDREAGVFAPFFGMQANTMTLLPRLARKSGATVLLVYAERLPRGRGYHLHFLPTHENLHSDDPLVAARSLNQAVEAGVCALPAQYQWTYKRFKTRPPGEKGLY